MYSGGSQLTSSTRQQAASHDGCRTSPGGFTPSRSQRASREEGGQVRRPPVAPLDCTIGTEKRRQDRNAWFEANRKSPADLRLGKPLYLPCNVRGVRPGSVEPSFGTLVEDAMGSVQDLTSWTPRDHSDGAQPTAILSRLYRTTTKHGSKAHTVWDCVWERPVERTAKIQAEIDRKANALQSSVPPLHVADPPREAREYHNGNVTSPGPASSDHGGVGSSTWSDRQVPSISIAAPTTTLF